MAGTDLHARTGRHGAEDVGARLRDRLGQRFAQRQVRGDGGRQRAARAVQVAAGNALRSQARSRAIGCSSTSTTSSPGRCPPLSSTPFAPSASSSSAAVSSASMPSMAWPISSAASSRLGVTTRRAGTVRAPAPAPSRLAISTVAAGGDHDGVEHHGLQLVAVDGPGHHLDHLGRVQHADLDGVDADVLGDGLDLVALRKSAARRGCRERPACSAR
jgi:hypothetical protein